MSPVAFIKSFINTCYKKIQTVMLLKNKKENRTLHNYLKVKKKNLICKKKIKKIMYKDNWERLIW